ncbi:MAG: hypothetical protein K5770_18790 [Lachnospiraceae bacterium]|nr:hypothetical protein [Lachnospiraceae bacterium]
MVGKKVSEKKEKELLCDDIAGKDCGLKKVIDIVGGIVPILLELKKWGEENL